MRVTLDPRLAVLYRPASEAVAAPILPTVVCTYAVDEAGLVAVATMPCGRFGLTRPATP